LSGSALNCKEHGNDSVGSIGAERYLQWRMVLLRFSYISGVAGPSPECGQ